MKGRPVLLALLLVPGCAPRPAVRLDYRPQTGVSVLPGAGKVAVAVAGTDRRKVKDRVSATRNGLGMEYSPIPAENDPLQLLVAAIETELEARGFAARPEPGPRVELALSKAYNTFGVGIYSTTTLGEFSFDVTVKAADGRATYARVIEGRHRVKGILKYSGENAKLAIEKALEDAVAQLFSDPAFLAALASAGS